MSEKNDGGFAFPVPAEHDRDRVGVSYVTHRGMSMRDWFAGQALAGLLANSGGPIQANGMSGWGLCNCDAKHVTQFAYELADDMLAERAKQ